MVITAARGATTADGNEKGYGAPAANRRGITTARATADTLLVMFQ